MSMRRLLLASTLLATAASLALAPSAGAHVEPSATEVPAGSQATVDFTVQHGCDGSDTTKVEFQVPEEITDVAPVDKDGWETSASGRVVTFEGGPLDAETEDTFAVTFTAPAEVGASLAFPFVQTCEEGSIDWIQLEEDAERPAPIVIVGDADPNAPQPTEPETEPEAGDDAATTTAPAAEPEVEDETAQAPTTAAPAAGEAADADDADDGGSSAPLIIGLVVLVTAGAVGFAVWQRRSSEP
jgi:uncharacterized protein YcnI